MPRLTRTQKFADLRDSLANDREPSLSTKDLSDYENKLSNITGQLPNNETVDKAPQTIKEETDPRYVWTSFQEPKTNPVDELVETIRDREFEKTLTQTSAFNSIQEFPTEKSAEPLVEEFKAEDLNKDSHVEETAAADEPMIKTRPVPDIDFMIDDILASNPSVSVPENNTVVSEPIQTEPETVQEVNPFMEDVLNTQQPSEPLVQETEEEYEEERQVIEETPVEEVSDNRAADHVDVFNDYIDATINEVSAYNKRNGETTISDLTSNMVNEIRHHVEPEYVKPAVEEAVIEEPVIAEAVIENEDNQVSDEEFSNTVSMEISKIMDEISTIEPSEKNEVEYTYNEQEDPQQYIDAPDEIEEVDVVEEEYVEEHPVLAKKLEEEKEEEVVEIKNLKELEAEPVKQTGTISNTIPFVVATEEEDIIDEDDEDEGSNTILNIILVVLIIVLVAVLGLIIFYILKTKGII